MYFKCQECSWYTEKAKIKISDIHSVTADEKLAQKYPVVSICENCGACDWTIEAGKRLVYWWNPFSWFTRKILWRSEIVKQQELKKKEAEALRKHEEALEKELQLMAFKGTRNLIDAIKKRGIDDGDYVGVEPHYGPY